MDNIYDRLARDVDRMALTLIHKLPNQKSRQLKDRLSLWLTGEILLGNNPKEVTIQFDTEEDAKQFFEMLKRDLDKFKQYVGENNG